MNKYHNNIVQQLVLKKELISLKRIINENDFQGLRDIPTVSALFGCLKDELDVD